MKKTCGTCTACCSTVPVEEIGLPAFTRCPKLRSVVFAAPGCSIYPDRPNSCETWSCHWLKDDWPDDLRPDRCGVVVDIIPDLIRVNGTEMPALQIWALPGYEMAFTEQPVMAIVLAITAQGHAVIWRWRGADGQQTGRALFNDPKTGKLVATSETPPDKAFSKAMPIRERLKKAMALSDQDRKKSIIKTG
jgi:hypothetical protein